MKRRVDTEKLAAVRTIHDQIRARIETWCDESCPTPRTRQ